ncbi:MAG: VWA domain-containing protein [Gemmatimonadota bacterium]|nr:VWA domain-containing protein [Gemmatimonadota bacterium]
MRLRTLCCSVTAMLACLIGPPALADHALTPLITTPQGYTVYMTIANPYMPPGVEGTDDLNYFPLVRGFVISSALDFTGAFATGAPNGHHAGFLDLGFQEGLWSGEERRVEIYYCDAHGDGCDNGMSVGNPQRILVPADRYIGAPDLTITRMMGHELYHKVQREYSIAGGWGDVIIEGHARMMQDKIYTSLDERSNSNYVWSTELYLEDPDRVGANLWMQSYNTALWWNYLMEQFGTLQIEPTYGVDFIRIFYENAKMNSSSPDSLSTVQQTIQQLGSNRELVDIFHDFAITNMVKEFDMTEFGDPAKYRYVDENDGAGISYPSPVRIVTSTVPPDSIPFSVHLSDAWATKYFEVEILPECQGLLGFIAQSAAQSTGQPLNYGLIVLEGDVVKKFVKARTGLKFTRAFLQSEETPYTKLVAAVVGLEDPTLFSVGFGCGPPTIDIKGPTTAWPAYVGDQDDPDFFLVRLSVTGPSVLGTPTIDGLDPSDFRIYVGSPSPGNEATDVSGTWVQGEIWLTARAPLGSVNVTNDLWVELGTAASDMETDAVIYMDQVLDQVVTIDESGSMLAPDGAPKLDAAKIAAQMFVDVLGNDDQVGLVKFFGNNAEPDDDSDAPVPLGSVPVVRADMETEIQNMSTTSGVRTSIGDGLERARLQLAANGRPNAEHWITLLSDGMENEDAFYRDIKGNYPAAGIKINTIALGPYSDQALLQMIATDTQGQYIYVEVGEENPGGRGTGSGPPPIGPSAALANRLADAYAVLFEFADDQQRLWEVGGSVASGGMVVEMIDLLESGVEDGRFVFNWEDPADTLGVTIQDPFGATLQDGVDGVSILTDDTHVVFHKPFLASGLYTVQFDGVAGTPEYIGILMGRGARAVDADLYLGAKLDGTVLSQGGTFQWGVPMPILLSLHDDRGPVDGATVTAEILHPDGTVLALPLFDDGLHEDGNPGDGFYGNLYTRTTRPSPTGLPDGTNPPVVGSYPVRVEASGQWDGDTYRRIKKGSFHVFEILDPPADTDGDNSPDAYEDLHGCRDTLTPDEGLDPDLDTLLHQDEWEIGTSPCHPDTDRGGESDGSEVARGANPFDPADDMIPRPRDPQVIDYVPDHYEPYPLAPGQNLIRYPSHSSYQMIRLWRSLSPNGGFTIADEFVPDGTAFYTDLGLANGVTYYYRVQGVGLSNVLSAPSPIFSGTPKADPVPNRGWIQINNGAEYTDLVNVTLQLAATPADVTSMKIANTPDLAGASYEPFSETKAWLITPDANGQARVYAKFMDSAGNESRTYVDGIVVPPHPLGVIRVQAQLAGQSQHTGVTFLADDPETAPKFTDPFGFAELQILAGTYDVTLARTGFETVMIPNVVVTSGALTDLGVVALPEPGTTAMLASGLALLRVLHARRTRRSSPEH